MISRSLLVWIFFAFAAANNYDGKYAIHRGQRPVRAKSRSPVADDTKGVHIFRSYSSYEFQEVIVNL